MGLLRRLRRPERGHAPLGRSVPGAARPRDPGRAASHQRPARHRRRALRGGVGPAVVADRGRDARSSESGRFDRDRPARGRADQGAVRPRADGGVPAARSRPGRQLLRPHRVHGGRSWPPLCRPRRAGQGTEAGVPARASDTAGRGPAGAGRAQRGGRPLSPDGLLLHRAARAGRGGSSRTRCAPACAPTIRIAAA